MKPSTTTAPVPYPTPTTQNHSGGRATSQHTVLYFRQIYALLDAGVILAAALEEQSRSGPNRALREASMEMSRKVASGQPWPQALRAYPGLFSELAIGVIHVGETNGSLPRVCLQLSQYAEAQYHIQQLIKRETWYPKLLLFVSTVIVPLPIRFSLGGQSFVLGFLDQLLLIAVPWGLWKLANYLWPVGARGGKPRYFIDSLKLELPVIGKTTRSLAIAKFCRTLGVLTAAGVGTTRAVEKAADTCGNAIIANNIRQTLPRLQRGETLAAALAATGEFPPLTLQMLRTGETTGAVDEMLQKGADFLEIDTQTTLQKSIKLLGLLVFLLAALKIGVQVVQWWQAYYGL